jgi:CheY-like chemotaxis protein
MDLDMPVMNGYQTTEKILSTLNEKLSENEMTKIIACTAFVGE